MQPVTSEHGARHTARMIRMFRERLRLVETERACLTGMIDELTTVLFDYRQRMDENGRESQEIT